MPMVPPVYIRRILFIDIKKKETRIKNINILTLVSYILTLT